VKCQGEQCRFPPAPEFYGDWRRVNATLATRYPKAAGIEIWNEPNESSAWNYTADPGAYLDLLREGYKAIKAANPSMQVISGGLSNRQETGGGNLSLAEYVQRLFAGGAAQYMDGIGVHPYVQRDDLDGLDKTLDLVRGLRPRDLPIWVTEVGVTDTGPKDGTFYASDDEQAHVDATAYRMFRGQADVKAILIHTLIDPTDDAGDPESGFGVLRGDLSEKPAYCALARETGARRSCP
jgi:GH35 family endo-1,4-beta-xylanase